MPSRFKRNLIGLVLIVGLIVIIYFAFSFLKAWSNENSGFVSLLGLFLVVPCTIWAARLLERKRRKRLISAALELLVYELWHNLNYVSQIERSYHNNLVLFGSDGQGGLHMPHFGPRLIILEKFLGSEHLEGLHLQWRLTLIEIVAQLSTLKEEFSRWREMVFQNNAILNDRDLYVAFSSTMLSVIDPLMRNMVLLWSDILTNIEVEFALPQIRASKAALSAHIPSGTPFKTSYRSSYFNRTPSVLLTNDVIVCWQHDWTEAPVSVVSLDAIAALHDTWMPN